MIEHLEDKVLIKVKNELPHVYEQIKNSNICEEEIRLSVAKNIDVPIVERFVGGKWTSLYSKFNPLEEAEKWTSSIEGAPKHIILFGFGLGYHYEALKKRFSKAIFHVIEPDPQMFLLYSSTIEGSLKNKLSNIEHLLISQDKSKFYLFFEKMIEMIDESWLVLSVPKYQVNYEASYKHYVDAFKKAKDEFRKKMFSFHWFEKMWNENVLKNLPYIYQTTNIFDHREIFEGRSIILVASGPSLNEAIPFLQRIKYSQKAILVAAGTSINSLLNKGIEPDLCVSYDPREANYINLKPSLESNIPFVFGTTIYNQIPSEYIGPKVHMNISQDTITRYLDSSVVPEHIVDDAPTITAVVLDMLYKLKVRDIYLVGQDLCFIGDKYQAEGVYPTNKEGRIQERHLQGKQYVLNNAGQQAETNESFKNMKDFIEEKIKDYKDINIYNLSLFGAQINGIDYCSYQKSEEEISHNAQLDFDLSSEFRLKEHIQEKLQRDLQELSKDVHYFLETNEIIQRQYEKFKILTNKQKEKWRYKIDQTLERITKHSAYVYLIYPFMVNRISYMLRLRSNCDFTSIEGVADYYKKGLEPFIGELREIVQVYNTVLNDLLEYKE
jgi:hypothetical protein